MFPLSLLKILFFLLAWIITWLPLAIPLSYKINYQFPQVPTVNQKLTLIASLYPFALIIMTLMMRREDLSWFAIGWQWQGKIWLFFILGVMLALGSLCVIFSLELATGLITWHWNNSKQLISLILPVFCLGLGISFVEELIFRGFLINELIQDFPLWISAIASSLIFALLHLVWERKKTIPQIPGLWLMGIVLVLARIVAEGNLALAIGLHTGWIFGLTCLDSANLISYNQHSKQWLTGINQEPLAGLLGIAGLLLTGMVLLVIGHWSLVIGHWSLVISCYSLLVTSLR